MFLCIVLPHILLECQINKGVHPKGSKSKLTVDRTDRSDYLNYMNDNGQNASCCTAMGGKLSTSPAVADTYICLINTWNTLPESYQLSVNHITLATVKGEIQPAKNQMPEVVISVEAARDDNPIYVDYLTSEVVLEEPVIGRTVTNLPIDINCLDDELY